MNLEPFCKTVKLFGNAPGVPTPPGVPSRILDEMQREADNVERIALAILKAQKERKETDKPTILDGVGAQLHTLIRELTFYRNTYDMKIVELRIKGEETKFAIVWRDLYSYITNQILDIKPNVRTEVQTYERFIQGQRALAQRRGTS